MEQGQIIDTEETSMVLIMGVTGSGKSRFVNTLVAGSTAESAGLYSCTPDCRLIQTKIGEHTSVAIVDTPGFDDTTRTDAEIFSIITTFLTSQYQLGIPLRGIIYLHRITDLRMQGSALRNFQMFQKICGDKSLGNVVLLTTMWDKLVDEMEGFDRDQELRSKFWSLMEEKGSYITRFDGSKDMAEAMIGMLLAKDPVVLDIQRELQDGKRLDETAAGRLLAPDLDAELSRCLEHIDSLERRIQQAEREKDRNARESLEREKRQFSEQRKREERERQILRKMVARDTEARIRKEMSSNPRPESKWKATLQVFATITGATVSVVMNLLPLFGVSL